MNQSNLGPYEQLVKDQLANLPQDGLGHLVRVVTMGSGSNAADQTFRDILLAQHPHIHAYLHNQHITPPMSHRGATECPVCRDPRPYTPPSYPAIMADLEHWYMENITYQGFPLIHVNQTLGEALLAMFRFYGQAHIYNGAVGFTKIDSHPVCPAMNYRGGVL